MMAGIPWDACSFQHLPQLLPPSLEEQHSGRASPRYPQPGIRHAITRFRLLSGLLPYSIPCPVGSATD